jgi:hypothetical protein
MANFNFLNQTDEVRKLMMNELNSDIKSGSVYLSSRLNITGQERYIDFIRNAIQVGSEATLQISLESGNFFNPTYERQGKPVKMPSNAAQLLAQSEYNRYYIRGICLKAIDDNLESVEIYRARESSWVRPESEMKIGKKLNAKALLQDLRNTIGQEPNILPEINSGLSVRI